MTSGSATPLADQAARDRVASDLGSTLFVEASAGTGKTTALVGRIVQLVASGTATPESIAAITFTEAAAAELRDRVLMELQTAAEDEARSEAERARCVDALPLLEDAAVETIHAFAARLLRAHPVEAGLPPSFEVSDETFSAIAFDERWRVQFDAMLEDPELRDPLVMLLSLGVGPNDLRALGQSLHEHWDRLGTLEDVSRGDIEVEARLRSIVQLVRGVCALSGTCRDSEDPLYIRLPMLEAACVELEGEALDRARLARTLASARLKVGRIGRKPNWLPLDIDDLRADLDRADEERQALLADLIDSALAPVVRALSAWVVDEAERRRLEGRAEFHDLLVRARDLLRGHAHVRASLRHRFTHLLIDEFQDTDPLQAEIVLMLASPEAPRGEDDWLHLAVDDGRLFFVGDPKQSIYRFRRADIELYQQVQERFADCTLRLVQGFRSAPGVVAWVNALFERLLVAQPGQPAYVPLTAYRGPHPDGATVRYIGRDFDASMAAVREAEGGAVARAIHAVKGEGWQVLDKDGDRTHYRPARFQDVALLVRTRTALPQILQALEDAGIPYRLESRSLVYDTQEVRDLLAVLGAIDDPTDEIAVVGALRSPAFACSDDDLAEFAMATGRSSGRWDYRRTAPDSLADGHPVLDGMRWLRERYEERWWVPVSTMVERVIRERRLLELALVDRRPRERWQRLRFVLDQARAFMDAGGRTLREFLAWAALQAEEDRRVVETVVPERDDDAVRIMTIHAAKGLEFPVVLLAGLNIQYRNDAPNVLWYQGRPEVRMRPTVATAGYEAARTHHRAMEHLEERRLLYVAMTRARDHLVLSLFRPQSRANSSAQVIVAELDAVRDHIVPWEPPPLPPLPEPPAAVAGPEPWDGESWLVERREAAERRRRVPAVSATELARDGHEDPGIEKEPPEEDAPVWRRGRAGTAIGRAVHATLQTVDLASGADLEPTARAQAAAEGVTDRAGEVVALARAALESPTVREASASRHWREVYVSASVDGVLVEGFIDLLYETPEGFVVVDYKTDRLPATADVDAALEHYRPQGAAYALALSGATGRPVVRVVFLFLGAGVAREIDDLPRAVEEVRGKAALLAR